MEKNRNSIERISTGVQNLDELLGGGLPVLTISVVGGTPGSGKTILSQQICFANATPTKRALIVQTLSEPTAKTLRYLRQFDFFDPSKLEDGSITFVDLGDILRSSGLAAAIDLLKEQLKKVKPAFVVIDSFKVFSDLAAGREDIRKFTYEVAINLMAWECTGFLLGEFNPEELQSNPLSSVVDGILMVTAQELSGEQQRFIQISKMRGTNHDRDKHPFDISVSGINIFAPQLLGGPAPSSSPLAKTKLAAPARIKTGIFSLDKLLGGGLTVGSTLLVAGNTGTGKTLLGLEAIYLGASKQKEKGIYFTFEETPEQLIAAAQGMGWDLQREIARGMVEIVYIPQPEILVERNILMMHERISRLGARRVVVDSLSDFLHKVQDLRIAREKTLQIGALIQRSGAVGFLMSGIPIGASRLSRFGVEETVADGIVILTVDQASPKRQRYLEIRKLRGSNHHRGPIAMEIRKGGIALKGK